MAKENWLFRATSTYPLGRRFDFGTKAQPSSKSPSLTAEEYILAAASAVATPKALLGPVGLAGAMPAFVQNIRQRAELNRRTYEGPMEVPPGPPDVSVDADMREAARRHDPLWFFNQVKGHGPWDYKYRDRDTAKYDAYGNFVFGAAGTALGLSPETLRRGSGAAQIVGDAKKAWKREGRLRVNLANGVPWGKYPYGNQSDDQPNIDLGIRYAKERGY